MYITRCNICTTDLVCSADDKPRPKFFAVVTTEHDDTNVINDYCIPCFLATVSSLVQRDIASIDVRPYPAYSQQGLREYQRISNREKS